MKCVAPPTPQPRQSDNACEDRSVDRYAMQMEKPKHKITMRRRFTYLNGNCACRHTALIVLSSLLRREKHFLDDDLARINSTTAQTSCSIHVPPFHRIPRCHRVKACSWRSIRSVQKEALLSGSTTGFRINSKPNAHQRGFQNNCTPHELPRKVRSCANATGALQINDKCEDRTCHHTTLIV